MAFQSSILQGSQRLDRAAAGGPSVKQAPPPDDPEAIKRIQLGLRGVGYPMTKSFSAGLGDKPDGQFGQETYDAVLDFQKRRFPNDPTQWDGRVGPNTLREMDRLLPKDQPGPKPSPQPEIPLSGVANAFLGHLGPGESKADLILEYYRLCGLETIGPAQIEVSSIKRYATFEGLIEALINSTTFVNVVINHGDIGNGLLIQLCPESKLRKTGLVIGALSELADRSRNKPLDPSESETKLFLRAVMRNAAVSQQVVQRIVGKLVKLRTRPRIVHLRACKMETEFMALRYKRAFGAVLIAYHGTRIIFQRIDPRIPDSGESVASIFSKTPSTAIRRVRKFEDSLGEFAMMMIGLVVVLNDAGDAVSEQSIQLIDRRNAADLTGWAGVLVRRWRASVQKGFVIPIMWADEGETTFHCPMESGWREKLKFA